ncbi:MAG: hypothetical protein ACLS89_02345, partial [Collinsella sp.]
MAKTVYSDNQQNVDALAERLSGQTSLSAERAKLVAYDLLCRKALKIKSSALAQIFRSVDKECDTKAMRDELIAAKIVTKIEGSGINGRPAFYTINAEIRDAQEQPPSPSRILSSRIPLTCLLWKKLLRVSMSIPMSCSMRTSCVPLRPRQDAAVLAGVASAMRSAAPSRSASVAPLLKRVRRMLRPSRKSPSGCRSRLSLKSMLRSRSPSVAAVPTLRPS